MQEAKIKELEAANTKLQRGIQTTSGQAAKYKKSTEELKLKSDGLEGQLNSLRKVRFLAKFVGSLLIVVSLFSSEGVDSTCFAMHTVWIL